MNLPQLERDRQRLTIYFDNLKREALRRLINNQNSTIISQENPYGSTRVIEIAHSVIQLAKNDLDKIIISEIVTADSTTVDIEE